jgi:hypothetical protein
VDLEHEREGVEEHERAEGDERAEEHERAEGDERAEGIAIFASTAYVPTHCASS